VTILEARSEHEAGNWIHDAAVPRRLILAWQAPDQFGERHRWAVGEIVNNDGEITFRYFGPGSEFEALNPGRSYEALLALGFRGYPAFRGDRVHRDNVLAAFMRRLPPRSRADFSKYKQHFRIHPTDQPSDFALLGLTEAKLPSDGFSIVNTLEDETGPSELFLEVAGHRYYAAQLSFDLQPGQTVEFIPEPDNPKDPNAVKVCVHGEPVGYINRLQASRFLEWIAEGRLAGSIERLNGSSERPRVFLFVRLSSQASI